MKVERQKKLKVCYILSYYAPNYVRTHTLLEALKSINNIKLFCAINTSTNWLRYWQTTIQVIKIRLKFNPDYYILGFRGHEIFWIIRLLTAGKFLIFDSFVSPSDILINEKKFGFIGASIGHFISFIEKLVLKYSDLILTDTISHHDFFIKTFNLPAEKVKVIYVGAFELTPLALPIAQKNTEPFNVLYYGSFLPLHGMDVIIEAIALLWDTPIQFTIIGGKGKSLKKFLTQKQALGLKNVNHIKWVDFNKLCDNYITNADICFGGPFGNTNQAHRVITGKTFQCLTMKKTTIIGKTFENIGFQDKLNCLMVEQGNSKQLAEAIRWSYLHQKQLHKIGQQGYNLYQEKFSISVISEKLQKILL